MKVKLLKEQKSGTVTMKEAQTDVYIYEKCLLGNS